MKNIVETAVEDGRFTMLVEALKAAGLTDDLKGTGPFTVFAPTDDAFKSLPAGTVENLLKDVPNLKAVLTYHVVPGKVSAADVAKMNEARTSEGKSVNIKKSEGRIMINDAHVVISDVQATNGIIHVIDRVLMPPK